MRTKNVLKNGAWAIWAYAITFALNLLIRRKFLFTLNNDILGYEGTIGSVFAFLTISEAGIGAAITYRLYESLANGDELKTAKLMKLYECSYRVIGALFLVLSLGVYFVLPFFFEGNNDWHVIYVVYVIAASNMFLQYYLSTKRLLLITDQKAYICVAVDLLVSFIVSGLKILVLSLCPDYRLYLVLTIVSTISSNVIISYICYKRYPYIRNAKVTFDDFKREKLFKDIKNYLVQKVCFSIYGGVDNLLTSKILGVNMVTLASNYRTIEGNVTSITEKAFSGLQSSVGNAVYTEDKEALYKTFTRLDFVNYLYTAVVTCCLMFVFQPFIKWWLGEKYFLPYAFVFMLSARNYVAYNQRIINLFRGTVGSFEKDKKYIVVAAGLNVIISLSLIGPFGLAGLEAGTMIAASFIWIGRAKIVFANIFSVEQAKKYALIQIKYVVILLISMSFIQCFITCVPIDFGFFMRIIVSVICPATIISIMFCKTHEFSFFLDMIKRKIKR